MGGKKASRAGSRKGMGEKKASRAGSRTALQARAHRKFEIL
jgi:hypothetical protein